MLFNSPFFIFIFLPIVVFGFYYLSRKGFFRLSIAWLVAASLFFYGWWNPIYLILILSSILFNYFIGRGLSRNKNSNNVLLLLTVGVFANVGLLIYFKYTHFFIDISNSLFNASYDIEAIILPLAISFFTFQQIAYLVDAYKGKAQEYNFLHYCLFVTFFPQLIAGPIVHHSEMLPQFSDNSRQQFILKNIVIGMTIFSLGLFKKVILADGLGVYATPIFNAAEAGSVLSFFEGWFGSSAYLLQLYFDFSGYSDMAVGLAAIFGIVLPLNFNSPLKSHNIINFWSRWHITLSRFIQDYIYTPIAISSTRFSMRNNLPGIPEFIICVAMPTGIAFFLAGLWHGAGWNFVIFGLLHGSYLIINQAWLAIRRWLGHDVNSHSIIGIFLGRIITLLAVLISFVFFRAESFDGAKNILIAMTSLDGMYLPETYLIHVTQVIDLTNFFALIGVEFSGSDNLLQRRMVLNTIIGFLVVFLVPNTMQIIGRYWDGYEKYSVSPLESFWKKGQWQPNIKWAFVMSIIFVLYLSSLSKISEFLYFQF
tara:strand:- start:1313 stop:2923 length:1611 start_codon:yes stop_codon:yes gene_type:complete